MCEDENHEQAVTQQSAILLCMPLLGQIPISLYILLKKIVYVFCFAHTSGLSPAFGVPVTFLSFWVTLGSQDRSKINWFVKAMVCVCAHKHAHTCSCVVSFYPCQEQQAVHFMSYVFTQINRRKKWAGEGEAGSIWMIYYARPRLSRLNLALPGWGLGHINRNFSNPSFLLWCRFTPSSFQMHPYLCFSG